jgi:hypothetical protein
MKILRAILFAAALAAISAPAFPAAAALKDDPSCGCVCCESELVTSVGSGVGGTASTTEVCSAASKTTQPTPVDSESKCDEYCGTVGKGYIRKSCVKADCWCKDGDNFSFLGQSATPEACIEACKEAKAEFGNWGAPPPAKSSAVKCPPGGMWTQEECEAVTDQEGDKMGEWLPPTSGDTKGPHCYVLQKPVKLSVAVGGLTSANLAQYVSAAYRLAMGVAAVLAVIFIMIGGFRYMAAAGGGDVSGAKDMIKNAVLGLVLTALSYTLLQTVNPDIVGLRLPRVQIVKPCNIEVSCAARGQDKESCEKNNPASGMRCIWDIVKSICYDNSSMQSSALGSNGGDCMKSADGARSCVDGSKCIQIDSKTYKCSQGKECQACKTDGDCGSQNGAPGKCDTGSNMCMVADPNGQRGSYIKCANSSCKKDTDCDTGFCNPASRTCQPVNQGKDCTAYGQDDCGSRYKCVDFKISDNITKHACCLNGDANSCLGCTSDSFCPSTMFCMDALRYAKSSPKDPKTEYKCVNK